MTLISLPFLSPREHCTIQKHCHVAAAAVRTAAIMATALSHRRRRPPITVAIGTITSSNSRIKYNRQRPITQPTHCQKIIISHTLVSQSMAKSQIHHEVFSTMSLIRCHQLSCFRYPSNIMWMWKVLRERHHRQCRTIKNVIAVRPAMIRIARVQRSHVKAWTARWSVTSRTNVIT